MAYSLPELPYAYSALDPYISPNTLEFHHDKHHAAYVKNFNDAVQGTDLEQHNLEWVIQRLSDDSERVSIFNNAAQAWNHTFYWSSMQPNGGGQPTGDLARKIDDDLGGFDNFVSAFKAAATSQFGSGWAWLVLSGDQLQVTKTANADNPLCHNQVPLLTVDVWEHAYYLDYQNKRPDYIQTFLDHLINWDFAAANLAQA